MFDQTTQTAQDALDLIEANQPPLDFGTGVAVYRAAIKRLSKTEVSGFVTADLGNVPMHQDFLTAFFERLDRDAPPASSKERKAVADWRSRLRTITRRLNDAPVVRSSPEWDALLKHAQIIGERRKLQPEAMIPLTTLRQAAAEASLAPASLTKAWLDNVLPKLSKKQRDSLRRAASIIDAFYEDFPDALRPAQKIGALVPVSTKRKSNPLPPIVSQQLEGFIMDKVKGQVLPGFNGGVSVKPGIKADQSTNIYRQAMGWMFDVLCALKILEPEASISMEDLARLDWVSIVAAEAIAHYDGAAQAIRFPWQPITPKTVYDRIGAIVTVFDALCPSFKAQTIDIQDHTTARTVKADAASLKKSLGSRLDATMTDAHKAFCRTLVTNPAKQNFLLNMHTICWSQAQARWKNYPTQDHHERMQTINLCILAAILAIVVNLPFRARTVVEMTFTGTTPDVILAKGKKTLEFQISPSKMKADKGYDAVLEDTPLSMQRQIVTWFIAGPRKELLRDRTLLRARNRAPDRLFAGINTARYNRILSAWTEEMGMRMTTHLFRHAIASVLINCCNVTIREIADLLGNTEAVVERSYAFHDLVKRRTGTLHKIADRRKELHDAQHPGRRRK